ncbi:hypothetical protein L6164_028283 [Bauhinia variegata]|uniref:Uncharacterized protein n=1 Tax=Bauhinia variegata TaxID=167791 RepID=A0ACB9LVE2_BAUVA|nr:hypothetical protein L6164_028283 [Bauhinia variegata]
MEAFSLLKYWRGGGGVGAAAAISSANAISPTTSTTIVTAVAENVVETDDEDDDDGPFFDLEFTIPDEADDSEDGHENPNPDQTDGNSAHSGEEDGDEAEHDDDDESDGGDGEREFKFMLSPSSNDRSDPNLSLSPSDDLFFKGKLVQVEPSSFVLNPSEPNSKAQFPALLLKSATKFRVFMLGLKKSKSNTSGKESSGSDSATPKQSQSQQPESLKKLPEPEPQKRKLFTVKFKFEEVPIMSLFTRDNSSRGASGNKSQKQSMEESPSEEKRFTKEVMHKYLKMVKPLYIRVSRKYEDKLRFSGQLNISSGGKVASPPAKPTAEAQAQAQAQAQTEADVCETAGANNHIKNQKQGNLPAGLRVVCKHLGKSRSASSAVAAAPPGLASSKRRDDSLLQQQDGIQGAILHCKRSFNASRESEASQLPRSASDPFHEISPEVSRMSTEKGKDNHRR